ncbi:hypothetical protein QUB75_04910 [Microcoleus sp. K1-B6]|uniref:hypothetical protein n=1 Tax=unclassified Microcoleus TaxID=2642155 RepID=UPI002FD0016E
MTASEQSSDRALQEKHKELAELQAEVNKIFAEAITNQVKTLDFATEIWVQAMLEKRPYVAIACRMIHHSTNFLGDELLQFLRYLATGTLQQDASIVYWAVDLVNQGLIINNTLKENNENGECEMQNL